MRWLGAGLTLAACTACGKDAERSIVELPALYSTREDSSASRPVAMMATEDPQSMILPEEANVTITLLERNGAWWHALYVKRPEDRLLAGPGYLFPGPSFDVGPYAAGELVLQLDSYDSYEPHDFFGTAMARISGSYPNWTVNFEDGYDYDFDDIIVGVAAVPAKLPPNVDGLTIPTTPVLVGSAASVSANFTDRNVADVHTATVDWGDGTTSAGVVTESDGSGTVEGSHIYSGAGLFTVQVTVSDGELTGTRGSSGEVPAYLVVYDPAGSVIGSGWFDSPVGACRWQGCASDGGTTGRATFRVTAKYENGATVPSGLTAFQFAVGGLNFNGDAYEWLVVAGSRAVLTGSGMINANAFRFLLSAVDGGSGGHLIRIRIWEQATGDVVYDNQPGAPDDALPLTQLAAGKVTIQRR